MKNLIIRLHDLKEKEKEIKDQRALVEEEIYGKIEEKLDDDKTITIHADEYTLKVKPNFSVKVDQDAASRIPGSFKIKYEMSYSQYKKSEGAVDDYVTVSPLKPTFSVEIK